VLPLQKQLVANRPEVWSTPPRMREVGFLPQHQPMREVPEFRVGRFRGVVALADFAPQPSVDISAQ